VLRCSRSTRRLPSRTLRGNRGLMPIRPQRRRRRILRPSIPQFLNSSRMDRDHGWKMAVWNYSRRNGVGLALAGTCRASRICLTSRRTLGEQYADPRAMDKPMRSTMCNSNAVSRKMYGILTGMRTRGARRSTRTQRFGHHHGIRVHSRRQGDPLQIRHHAHGQYRDAPGLRKATILSRPVIDMKWVGACPAGMKLGMSPDPTAR